MWGEGWWGWCREWGCHLLIIQISNFWKLFLTFCYKYLIKCWCFIFQINSQNFPNKKYFPTLDFASHQVWPVGCAGSDFLQLWEINFKFEHLWNKFMPSGYTATATGLHPLIRRRSEYREGLRLSSEHSIHYSRAYYHCHTVILILQ